MDELELDCCIYRSSSMQLCFDASLVLTARAIDNSVLWQDDLWTLWVADALATQARSELESYESENLPPAIRPRAVVEFDSGWLGVLGYLLVIWCLPWLQNSGSSAMWLQQGSLQVGLVHQGEWWRCFTALSLHGGLAHLLSNSVFGSGFGLLLGRYLGSGVGWLLVVLAGAAGNWLNAAVRPDDFVSIGASTANFATIGLLGTFVWQRGYFRGADRRRGFAPVFAAIGLFAMLGVGEGPVDVVAHLTGFCCGALVGWWVPRYNLRRLGVSGQWLAGAGALGLMFFSWQLALAAVPR